MRVVISTEDDLKHRTAHGWISVFESVAEVPNDLLDGSVHQDTLAGTVVRGDIIRGNSTPAWARLAGGANGDLLGSDGTDTAWRKYRIVADGANVVTSSTTEVSLKSTTITGGWIGANGMLKAYFAYKKTGTAGTGTLKTVLGATTLETQTIGATEVGRWRREMWIVNKNAQNSNEYSRVDADTNNAFRSVGGNNATGSVDTSADQTLDIRGNVANAADSLTIYGWHVVINK